ncbi:hypothetical protein D3C73_1621480 [compost metagenome]
MWRHVYQIEESTQGREELSYKNNNQLPAVSMLQPVPLPSDQAHARKHAAEGQTALNDLPRAHDYINQRSPGAFPKI